MGKETKKERFKRVGEKRVQNIIKALRSLSGLSNTKVYEWEGRQLDKIWKVVGEEIESCKKRFKDPNSGVFKL